MPRKNRLFIQGLPHLVRLRGHNSQPLFLEPADYQYCLTCLDKALQEYDVNLHGYSLNADQVLLLLSAADKQQLGRFMQQLAAVMCLFIITNISDVAHCGKAVMTAVRWRAAAIFCW